MSLKSTVEGMIGEDAFREIMTNPMTQFGRGRRRYLGATILPERLVPHNKFEETNIRYRTVLANDGSRYSPAQKKGNDIIGSFDVSLGYQDIASEFTSEDYDNHVAVARVSNPGANPSMAGVIQLTNWVENRINLPLIEKVERMRWEAIVDAAVQWESDGGSKTISLPNPAGHRAAIGGNWTLSNYNPLDDIYEMADFFEDKDYKLGRILMSSRALRTLMNNPNVRSEVGSQITVSNGELAGTTRRVNLGALNAYLTESGYPSIETYDLQYRKEVGEETTDSSDYFLKRDVMVGLALTGRNVEIDQADDEDLTGLEDVLGYTAIGTPAGTNVPGRMAYAEYFGNKPPRAEFEGWQASFPVVQDPEAIVVRTGITLG